MANRLVFLGLGAALMYFGDPQAGRRRRAAMQHRLDAASSRLQQARELVRRDARNRYQGLVAETRGALESGKRDGLVTAGTSLAHVAQDTASAWRRRRWSPAQRALAGAGGAALAMYGYIRGGFKGMAMCAAGSALVARATAKRGPGRDPARPRRPGREIHLRRCAGAAGIRLLRDLENLPHWLSHVREVRALAVIATTGWSTARRAWPVEWESEMIHFEEDREMTWHTVGDFAGGQRGGASAFEPEGGGTRIHVQMRYMPPGGAIGHAVARAFGADRRPRWTRTSGA
jgi:uncharacterized membrane protein